MAGRSARGALVALLVGAALLLLLDVRGAGPAEAVRGLTGAVTGPPLRAVAWVRAEATARMGSAGAERARIAALEQQLLDARAALGQRAAAREDAASAEALMRALPTAGYRMVAGRVVARSAPQDLTDAVTIAVGSGSGIAPGMVAIDSAGVVGVVAGVAPGSCTLRVVTDPATRLAARVVPSGEAGILHGSGEDSATLALLDPLGAMAVGDPIVTIGTSDGLVPADLPLGTVRAVTGSAADLTRGAQVDAQVDRSTLDRVAVLVPRAEQWSGQPGAAQPGTAQPGEAGAGAGGSDSSRAGEARR
jgi:rod shape-determining protein MreC